LLVFLGYGRQHLSFSNRLLTWARDAGYPVYILHQTVIIMIAFKVIQQPWGAWTKYWVVLGATLLTCVLLYEYVLRRFAVTRVAFGIKTHSNEVRPQLQEMGSDPISAECGNRPRRAQ